MMTGEDRPVLPNPIKREEPDRDAQKDLEAGEDKPAASKTVKGEELDGDAPAKGGETGLGTLGNGQGVGVLPRGSERAALHLLKRGRTKRDDASLLGAEGSACPGREGRSAPHGGGGMALPRQRRDSCDLLADRGAACAPPGHGLSS